MMAEENKKTYKRFAYSKEDLQKAMKCVTEQNLSITKAAAKCGIPKTTLAKKLKDDNSQERKMGPGAYLSVQEELKLKKWIISKAMLGFPMHPDEVKDAVMKILEEEQRPNPFTENRPGRKWMDLFLKRHPEITLKNTEVISKARAAVTEEDIRKWFNDLFQYLREQKAEDILQDGSRIINLDETGVATCPSSGKVLGPRKEKNLYQIASSPEKQCITVLCTFTADGGTIDPMILYPYVRIPRDIAASVPDGFSIGRSDSGWMTSATYYEFIANVLYPRLVEKNTKFPVLLLFDGHKSHINMQLHDFCVAHEILLFCLFPNSTHILQPCDVGIFRPLKVEWRKVVNEYRQSTTKYITKLEFAPLFKKAFSKSINPETVKKSFETCGLFPFDPNRIDYSKCISTRREKLNESLTEERSNLPEYDMTINDLFLQMIESEMPSEVLDNFQNYYAAEKSPTNDVVLFKIWKKLKNKKNDIENTSQNVCTDDVLILSAEDSNAILSGLNQNTDVIKDNAEIIYEINVEQDELSSGTQVLEVLGKGIQQKIPDSSEVGFLNLTENASSNSFDEANRNKHVVSESHAVDNTHFEERTVQDSTTLKKQNDLHEDIWRKHLHFPKIESNTQKGQRKKKEDTTYAITSEKWKKLQLEKLQLEIEEKKRKQKQQELRSLKKEEKEQEKLAIEQRKQERLKKKEEIEKKKAEKRKERQKEISKKKIEKEEKLRIKEVREPEKRGRGRPKSHK